MDTEMDSVMPCFYRGILVGRYNDTTGEMESIESLFGIELDLIDHYSYWQVQTSDELDLIMEEYSY